ncbi:MAG: prolyl oligopeptidase family serine peptidase [bacterium]|nr:prolyl oligopeptidase family serine peptidase [bacterium]
MRATVAPLVSMFLFATCTTGPNDKFTGRWPAFSAPPVRTEAVTEDYHGTTVADPYRWLEDQDGPATADFVRRQNLASRVFLDAIPERPAIHARLGQLWNFPRQSAPSRRGENWFYRRNNGLQNQDVLYVASSPNEPGRVLLDPNTLSEDGTVALGAAVASPDGKLLAYSTSSGGSDWQEWRVLDVATGEPLQDTIRWAKFTRAAWTGDSRGFFYQRYPQPAEGKVYESSNQDAQLCYHELGTEQSEDRVVYERPDQPRWLFSPEVTESGRFLIVNVREGSASTNRIAYADLESKSWAVRPLLFDNDAHYSFLGHDGSRFWFRTNRGAPLGAVLEVDENDHTKQRILVPEGAAMLRSAQVLGGHFVLHYLEDASSRVAVHNLDGSAKNTIELPGIGSVSGFSGRADDPVAFTTWRSFVEAPRILQHDFRTGETTTLWQSELPADTSDIVTSRRFLQSEDGTRLCLFLVHKRGIPLDGSSPCYLYGYGGFNIPLTPRFSVPNLVFVERGGIYAQAVIRGGSEYGEEWHQGGMLGNKQNVFDDFIACAEYLTRNGYTSRNRLAIGGGSNGGLLVGAVLTQRPDLIGAAIPEVGVLDMLRYHTFTIGHAWASEYGRSDDPAAFEWLYRYSPLHNLESGRHYPPTMVMTGDHDDRVLPGHSYKFGAALQAAQGGEAPILLRVETSAGHGAGKPLSKRIDEAADRWAFLAATLK